MFQDMLIIQLLQHFSLLYCDFVMYLEGVAACKHKIHVERIEFNAQFWAECLKSSNSFYEKFVVPRLLSV